ncbi:hypothetical protein L4O92_006191, partial [Pseudomonas aeruginosa]
MKTSCDRPFARRRRGRTGIHPRIDQHLGSSPKKRPSVGRAWRVACLRGGALQDQVAALFIGQLAARLFAEGSGAEHLHG